MQVIIQYNFRLNAVKQLPLSDKECDITIHYMYFYNIFPDCVHHGNSSNNLGANPISGDNRVLAKEILKVTFYIRLFYCGFLNCELRVAS